MAVAVTTNDFCVFGAHGTLAGSPLRVARAEHEVRIMNPQLLAAVEEKLGKFTVEAGGAKVASWVKVLEIVAPFVTVGASIKRRSVMSVFIKDSALSCMMSVLEGIGAFDGGWRCRRAGRVFGVGGAGIGAA